MQGISLIWLWMRREMGSSVPLQSLSYCFQDKPNSLFKPGGTSLVIHEKADDLKTDPSGNSGKRIACGAVK